MDTNYDKLEQVDISREMRTSFLDYSMSVIVQRALPDVRDGMKPVHRRILHSREVFPEIAPDSRFETYIIHTMEECVRSRRLKVRTSV